MPAFSRMAGGKSIPPVMMLSQVIIKRSRSNGKRSGMNPVIAAPWLVSVAWKDRFFLGRKGN
ncbi:hypothetical protein GCM10007867_18950 [Gluconobacter cerinus]|uniref:Transposase n=1 Tax=Gluconobacter cerinus TaxID=38307 RepID=A0AAV5NFV4_9PROT|nr:hypothetical protein GCM10007867_18950 [Gluconobacter cerinus]